MLTTSDGTARVLESVTPTAMTQKKGLANPARGNHSFRDQTCFSCLERQIGCPAQGKILVEFHEARSSVSPVFRGIPRRGAVSVNLGLKPAKEKGRVHSLLCSYPFNACATVTSECLALTDMKAKLITRKMSCLHVCGALKHVKDPAQSGQNKGMPCVIIV